MLYVLYIYPFFDLLSVYVYIAIKVELLYYIYIITIVKKRILQLQLSLKNFFFFQSRCQCVLLTHFRYVAFAVLWKNKSRCNFHWYGISSKLWWFLVRELYCVYFRCYSMTCDVRFIDTVYLIYYSHSCIVESIELIIPLNLHVPIPTQNITYTYKNWYMYKLVYPISIHSYFTG